MSGEARLLAEALEQASDLLFDGGSEATSPRVADLARRVLTGDNSAIVSVISEATGGAGSLNDQILSSAVADYRLRNAINHVQSDFRDTDEVGLDLGSPQLARAQAIIMCGQLVKNEPKNFWGSRPWTVTVTDASGLILWVLSMDGFASPASAGLG